MKRVAIRGNRSSKLLTIEGHEVKGLIDTGADCNVMREEFFRKLQGTRLEERPETFLMADGSGHKSLGRAIATTMIDGAAYQLEYMVVPNAGSSEQVIIGDDIRDHAMVQIYKDETIVMPGPEYVRMIRKEDEQNSCVGAGLEEKYARPVRELVRRYMASKAREEAPIRMKIVLRDETPISQ